MRGGLRASIRFSSPRAIARGCASLGALDRPQGLENPPMARKCGADSGRARQIYAQVIQNRAEIDDFIAEELVQMFIRCGSLSDAVKSLDELRIQSVVAWTATISAFARLGHRGEAFFLFHRMLLEGVLPNKVSFISIASACSSEDEADFLCDRIVERDLQRDRLVGTALVNLYGKFQRLDEAWTIFCALEGRDLVSWNSMLSAFSEHQQWRRSLELFKAMLLQGLSLDSITFLAALKACANLRDLSQAKLVHGQICESGLEGADMVGNTIVDTYGKCGSIDDALAAFERIPAKDIVSWNVMLASLSQNGSSAEAVSFFMIILSSSAWILTLSWQPRC
ncbi:putative pentatricopeptide repeat-containing protein At1g69350, mitochondrial [Selaginella moellendorffii]|uniref:putative pentatricopeptide repeat-containing protein At1g69350, mitochondrial n=1 Tax=Selaginella moellendorffii TaxID=88036 RepID=UPI000D1C54E9|nr:putative pentatricopeptide repeat-containing protein At1g69350, mitochondrial [Selaginella moellendorffii]|eukprot:XP_024518137.1 putative pentatricopeptide repeat-containing protein At1g69350, mitochondrial [Selaginella moellendorffii]